MHHIGRSERWIKMYENGTFPAHTGFLNKHHSIDTKNKMKIKHALNNHQQGMRNSQFGSCWITNENENKKIKRNEIVPAGWRLGRKMNTTT